MTEPTPLEHARAVKLRLRAASKKAAEARKAWAMLRALASKRQEHSLTDLALYGNQALSLWNDEDELAAVAEEWRLCLAARAEMPKAERWDLAALERWAVAQDKAGAT